MASNSLVKIESYTVRQSDGYGRYSSSWNETRYRIIDAATGELLDDAQGYGYKSFAKARAAWNWKHTEDYPAKQKEAGIWLEKHKKVRHIFEGEDIWKLKDPANDGVTKELCQSVIDESGEEVSFSASDLLAAWRKELYVAKKRNAHTSYRKKHK